MNFHDVMEVAEEVKMDPFELTRAVGRSKRGFWVYRVERSLPDDIPLKTSSRNSLP